MQYLLLSSHCSWLGSKQDDALTQLSQLVGPGKEFIPSEVPTLQTIIQRGILIRDRMLLEQGSAKTDVHIKDIVLELVFSDSGTIWQISNAKIAPPVTIKEGSIRAKVDSLWGKVEEVKHGRAGKGKGGGKGKGTMERDKFELLLDKLVDITTCPHSIQLCNDPGSGCKDGCSLLSMVNEMRCPSTLGSRRCQGARTLSPYQRQC